MLQRRTQIRRPILTAMAACLVGLAALPWDLQIWEWAIQFRIPGDIRKAIHLAEAFAHASGVAAILGALWWIDVDKRAKLTQAAIFTAICGIAANAAKYVIPRWRPHSLAESKVEIVSAWDTWGIPWTGSWFDESVRSFPSGHSATAAALAIGLSMVYPRGKWFFVVIAGIACLQRLISSAHFVSDIMGGVLISVMISIWFWRSRFVNDVIPSSASSRSNVTDSSLRQNRLNESAVR
jgi:membrane-associated phospholipid phosphatase